jgi:DNA polymerase II small subunit
LRFIESSDVSGKSKCKGHVEDFVAYFRDRVERTRKILEARGGGSGTVKTSVLGKFAEGRDVRVIGIIKSKRQTKKNDLLVELEDEEGIAKVWVGKGRNDAEKQCFASANNLLLDEVVAIDGKMSGPFLVATDVLWPEVPARNAQLIEKEVAVAFISDLHVGSKLFLEQRFGAFVQWLNGGVGGEKQKELAGKVKYLIVAGDIVDGIGIYPKQEKELVVRDIFEQYRMFGKLMESVPDYVEIIVAPGNHDAVRRAEPQPRVSDEIKEAIGGKMHLVGNPSMVEIEGLKTLVYHGTSLDSIIAGLKGLSYNYPEKAMVELVKRRNLSPLFGDNPIVPEHHDYMLIDDVPDIVHMGHIHKNGYDRYKGILIVNSGTWQDRTEFQMKQGHVPSPCLLPVYDMKRGELEVVNFTAEAKAPGMETASKAI